MDNLLSLPFQLRLTRDRQAGTHSFVFSKFPSHSVSTNVIDSCNGANRCHYHRTSNEVHTRSSRWW